MKLTDSKCKNQKPADSPVRIVDGAGLYLEIMPNGSKFWRQKYRFAGKEKRLTHGKHPLVSLADAREKRDGAKKLLLAGIDPNAAKLDAKLQTLVKSINTFEIIAQE